MSGHLACGMCGGTGLYAGTGLVAGTLRQCMCGAGRARALMQAPNINPPHLVVPRDARPAPLVKTEVELLRERVAAMEAQIAALTPPTPEPAPNPLSRGIGRWTGGVSFMQGLRWRQPL